MNEKLHIAVGAGHNSRWHEKLAGAFDEKIEQGYMLDYSVINMEAHNWQTCIQPYDVVIWNPSYMGPISAEYLKEKVYFIEKIMGKRILPNWASVWHFESKIAQSYIFAQSNVRTPATTLSFDCHDANEQIQHAVMPIVWKTSHGAASKNVRLIRDKNHAKQEIAKAFCQQLWNEAKQQYNSQVSLFLHCILQFWFWEKVWRTVSGHERISYVYWQEYIPDNPRDLRITVIGDRFAFGFWRNNRPNDFRASGSGRIDYQSQIPETLICYCIDLNRKLGFDSMCYDILFTKEGFVLTEMSYSYVDSAIHNANGFYELDPSGQLVFHQGHIWPQALWVEWALSMLNCHVI